MTATKVLRAFVHVVGADGYAVALPAGSTVPEAYSDQITNPAAYDVVEVADAESTPVTTTVTTTVTTGVTDSTDGDTPPWEKQPDEADTEAETEPETEAGTEADTESDTEAADESEGSAPAELADYSALTFAELQQAAKDRGLSGAGNTATLIARLEADDRDKK